MSAVENVPERLQLPFELSPYVLAFAGQFEQRFDAMHVRFDGVEVPRPPYWSGYRLTPQRLEFWEDRAHRLHDRHLFMRSGTNWTESLLFP